MKNQTFSSFSSDFPTNMLWILLQTASLSTKTTCYFYNNNGLVGTAKIIFWFQNAISAKWAELKLNDLLSKWNNMLIFVLTIAVLCSRIFQLSSGFLDTIKLPRYHVAGSHPGDHHLLITIIIMIPQVIYFVCPFRHSLNSSTLNVGHW